MKAMHDAKMKKKEDDKVAAKKKDVKEGSAYGITRGSGKASGAMKDYLDKKKKEKKKVDEACWKGYEKKGMKTMFGKRYPNCVKKTKKEEVQIADENFMRDKKYVERYKKAGGYLNTPARKKADAEHAKNNPKRKPFEKRKTGTLFGNRLNDEVQYESKDKKGITFAQFQEACWKGYEKKGMKTMFGKRYPNCVKKTKKEEVQYKDCLLYTSDAADD